MRFFKSGVVPAIVIFFIFFTQRSQAQVPDVVSTSVRENGAAADAQGSTHHPSRVLVRFRDGEQSDFLPGSGAASDFPGDPNLHLVPNPPGLSVAEAMQSYRANPAVLYVEPDYVIKADETPTDPRWNQQWDMMKISAPAAWATQTDSGSVVVAIIDSGIDFTHPDLQANLWTNSDGSHGFSCDRGKCAKGGSDDFGHGTHVAGTIGAVADNGIGIAGINWRVQLMSVKFIASDGNGYLSDAIAAFDKITDMKQQGINIRITNNSWGGGGFSQALKDAMSRGEAAGIVHVCAAGNSNQNADAIPMYPGAYDNRGVISVLASDQNDAGAAFTNYGIANVDIAAPGVSTLSTVPSGNCTLCDKTGYKLLSGTSMATPHVAGVLAALFHENPALTANEARDVLLDVRSYDAVTDAKAKTTSTGGRLNFAKALANPLLHAPVLNNFPALTMGPNVFARGGDQVNITATVSDPDKDPIRISWSKSTNTGWLMGWMINTAFPNPTSAFTAPFLARAATVSYNLSVADGRGGSAQGRTYLTVSPTGNAGAPPSGTLSVSATDAPVETAIAVSFPATDLEGGPVGWELSVGEQYGVTNVCCYTASTKVTFHAAGVYRISTLAVDRALNFSPKSSVVVRIGGATGQPPIASAVLDKLSGPTPLTVKIDASASVDLDGSIRYYYFGCGDAPLIKSRTPAGSCTFSAPGTNWIRVLVEDNNSNVDSISTYAVTTP